MPLQGHRVPHLRSPGKVARVKAKGTELGVSTPHAHSSYCDIGGQLGIGRLTSKLEPAQCEFIRRRDTVSVRLRLLADTAWQ